MSPSKVLHVGHAFEAVHAEDEWGDIASSATCSDNQHGVFHESTLSTVKSRKRPRDSGQNYQCDICGKSFARQSTLKRHIPTHGKRTRLSCTFPDCKAAFFRVHDRVRHEQEVHKDGERCLGCKHIFASVRTLGEHLKNPRFAACARKLKVLHEFAKPKTKVFSKRPPCIWCTKPFPTDIDALGRHLQAHINERMNPKYKCVPCDVYFMRERDLKYHQESARHDFCGFNFKHECSGHHTPCDSEEFNGLANADDRRGFIGRVLEWEQSIISSLMDQIDELEGITRYSRSRFSIVSFRKSAPNPSRMSRSRWARRSRSRRSLLLCNRSSAPGVLRYERFDTESLMRDLLNTTTKGDRTRGIQSALKKEADLVAMLRQARPGLESHHTNSEATGLQHTSICVQSGEQKSRSAAQTLPSSPRNHLESAINAQQTSSIHTTRLRQKPREKRTLHSEILATQSGAYVPERNRLSYDDVAFLQAVDGDNLDLCKQLISTQSVSALLQVRALDEYISKNGGNMTTHLVQMINDHWSGFGSALHLASTMGLYHAAEVLLTSLSVSNLRDAHRKTPLHCALEHGFVCIAELLLRHPIIVDTINSYDRWGQTALLTALSSSESHYDLIRLLLEKDADPNCLTPQFGSLLHYACRFNPEWTVDILLREGADANAISNIEGKTLSPLWVAVIENREDIVALLVRSGADIDLQLGDKLTQPLLLWAYQQRKTALVRLLIQAGANVNVHDSASKTLLHYVASSRSLGSEDESIISEAIERGAKLDARSDARDTPLHIACDVWNKGMAQLLLRSGANPKLRNRRYQTPIDIACTQWNTHSLRQIFGEKITGMGSEDPVSLDHNSFDIQSEYDDSRWQQWQFPQDSTTMTANSTTTS